MNSSCPFTWRLEWLCSSKWTSGGVQCVKLRSGLGEHNISKGRPCVHNDTHNILSVSDVKLKLFQDMNTVILILLMHLLVKHTVQILQCWNSIFCNGYEVRENVCACFLMENYKSFGL